MPSIYISPHNKIGYSFLTFTVLLFAGVIFGLFTLSYGSEIILVPEPEEVDINFEVQIRENETQQETEPSHVLIGKVLETVQEAQEKNTAQSTASMEDYAEGEIILSNNTWSSVTFVASTRFASPEDLIFRAINRLTIPAKGETTVPVRADKMGGEYDIGPTTFTIPNLRSPELIKNITAISEKPMTGGLKKTGIIMQVDIDKAQTALKEKIYTRGVNEIEKQLPDSNLKILVQSDILEEQVDAKAGDEKAEFTTLIKLKIWAAAFKEKDLLDIAISALKEKIPQGKELAAYEPNSLSYRLKDYVAAEGQATLEVQFRGYMIIDNTHESLEKTRLRDLTSQEIKTYLESFKEIRQARIKLWPPFILKKTPQNIDKIEITIKKFE